MAYGVIGNTAVFGTAILGSSPGRPAVPVSFGWRVLLLLVLLYDAHLTAGGHSVVRWLLGSAHNGHEGYLVPDSDFDHVLHRETNLGAHPAGHFFGQAWGARH